MDLFEGLCPKCGRRISIGVQNFGYPTVTSRTFQWNCVNCGAGEKRDLADSDDIPSLIDTMSSAGLAKIAIERDRIRRGRCAKCGREIQINDAFGSWRCSSCGAWGPLFDEIREAGQRLASDKMRREQYTTTILDFLQAFGQGGIFIFLWLTSSIKEVSLGAFLALYVVARMADYLTTQIGLAAGGIETNPASEATRLTGFWKSFLLWGVVLGVILAVVPPIGWFLGVVLSMFSFAAAIHNFLTTTMRVRAGQTSRSVAMFLAALVTGILLHPLSRLLGAIGW
jgi:ribosomal protein L37AE/L43A